MRGRIYIGIDDTDVLGGPVGTGRVARGMAAYLEKLNLGRTIGVIRHQLLVDPRIPYTSHNSAKCVEFEASCGAQELHNAGIKYLAENFQQGSDPGICTCEEEKIVPELFEYGRLAQKEIISKRQAFDLAGKMGLLLNEVGGTGDGIIGALAAVGLRAEGNDGRYVQLRGINEIKGVVSVKAILQSTGISAVIDGENRPVAGEELIDSQDWIKPNVVYGEPVLRIFRKDKENSDGLWGTIEQKHKKK